MIDISYHSSRITTKVDEKKHLMCYIDLSIDKRYTDIENTSNRIREDKCNMSNEHGVLQLILELIGDKIFDFEVFSKLMQDHMSKEHLIEFSSELQKAAFERMA